MLGFVFVAFIVIVGLAAVIVAASLALAPSERKLAVLRPLAASTAFASASAVLAGIGVSLKNAADAPADPTRMLHGGLAEAAVPGMLGFALLAVCWLLAAIGLRRQL